MASSILPYPDLSFKKGEVLRAEALNELQANIAAVAQMFSPKFSWVQLGERTLTKNSATMTSVNISDLPVGAKFLAAGVVQGTVKAETITAIIADIEYNGVGYGNNNASTWGTSVATMHQFEKVAGVNTVNLKAFKDNDNPVYANEAILFVMRVG
ncbi:MAG: hypothetical protein NC548_27290 [Lachnospiraceae bacterium]|nr:hypothetical protein [Lachnospiraceae bacterium]